MEFGQTPKQLFTSPHPKRGQLAISLSPSSGNLLNHCDTQPAECSKGKYEMSNMS